MYTFDQIVASAYFVFADLIIKDKNQNIGLSRTIICAYLEKYKIEKGLEFKNGKFALENLADIISFDGTIYKMNDNYTSKDCRFL